MPGRRQLLSLVALGVLCVVFFSVGAVRAAWGLAGGSFPARSSLLLLVLGAICLVGVTIAASRYRTVGGVDGPAVGTVRAGFAVPAVALVVVAIAPDVDDLSRLGGLQWLVLGAGVAAGVGVVFVPRLVAGGAFDRLIGGLAGYGAILDGSAPDGGAPQPGRFARFVVFGSLGAALVNAAIPTPLVSQPVRPHDEAALDHLIATEQAHLSNNYRLYAELRELAAGGAIVVPPAEILASYTLEGLSLLEVRTEDYDPELSGEVAAPLLDGVLFTGETETELGGETRPYIVAAPSGREPAVLRLLLVDGSVIVVDDAEYRASKGSG